MRFGKKFAEGFQLSFERLPKTAPLISRIVNRLYGLTGEVINIVERKS